MKLKTALVLGGGGARGFAHLGVLEVLEKENIKFDLVVGCSMGAVIGGGYLRAGNIEKLEKLAREVVKSDILIEIEKYFSEGNVEDNRLVFEKIEALIRKINFLTRVKKKWLFEGERIREVLKKIIPEELEFKALEIPFACVGVDILSGERIIFKEGKVLDAVLASSSIPGIFPPFRDGRRFIVDGGIVSQLPVEEAKILGAEYIIAVDVGNANLSQELQDGIDILLQCNKIMSKWLTKKSREDADFVISPSLSEISWFQFSKFEICVEKGKQKAIEVIEDLKLKYRRTRIKYFFTPFSQRR
jgi:NTE family protein